MVYTFSDGPYVDLAFSVTLQRERFPLGYVDFMWASYMNRTRDRRLHFYGVDGAQEGWMSFGDDTPHGFETGTVAHRDVDPLPYEPGSEPLNLIEHPEKTFLLPFYYGLVDGDGDLDTTDDTMVYIMMFDRTEEIRFAMWNFIQDAGGQADPHSPAWDWQYVVRDPEVGRQYGYRSRLVYKPFVDREDVRREYEDWVRSPARQ